MIFTLDKRELEIMELFWREDRALTHADISKLLEDTVGRNTVYLHLNTLLDKGAIQTGPSVRRGRTYGRTFIAAITKSKYMAMQVAGFVRDDDERLRSVFAALIDTTYIDSATLDELSAIIEQKRKELD